MLMLPCWPSAPFWPMIYPDGVEPVEPEEFIRDLRIFPNDCQPVITGVSGHAFPACDMIALQCCFGSQVVSGYQ